MQKLQYASYRGKLYKKDPRAIYTYTYKCKARNFINTLATNEQFKSRLIQYMKRIIELLSDPHCELFHPLVISYDLIEVNDGVCWSLKDRAFKENAIEERQIGKVSPRAFCAYDPSKHADPKYFREILENSLSENEVSTFCGDFLKLLNYNGRQHKDKVPCLVGDANSGKTSLFFPIQGHVHHGNIATVTKQRAFSKAMITPFTEVIFIDEAGEKTLDVADWKILTQGGYTAHDVKYQMAKAFLNKCPMLVTAQRTLDFGPADQPAMDRHLCTYQFKSLPNPKRKVAAWLKKHAMECVVWAAEKAKTCDDDSEDETDTESDDDNDVDDEEGLLKETEKEALRSLSLANPLATGEINIALSTDEEEDNSDEDGVSSTSIDRLDLLREAVSRSHPESLRHRQVQHMLMEEERKRAEEEKRKRQQHLRRKSMLRKNGVSTQNAELLPLDPGEEMPTPIVLDLEENRRAQREHLVQQRREKARLVFAGSWLRSTEKELDECVEKYSRTDDPYMRSSLMAYQEVLSDKLKLHHQNLGTFNTEEAVAERRRVCVELGILREADQLMVKNVTEPLPRPTEEQGVAEAEAGTEDDSADEVFTQVPSWQTNHLEFLRTVQGEQQLQKGTKRARKQEGRVRAKSQKDRGCSNSENTILKYFSSQK